MSLDSKLDWTRRIVCSFDFRMMQKAMIGQGSDEKMMWLRQRLLSSY